MANRYEILRSIAKGGMAEVFRARAVGVEGLDKVVALKRISPSFMMDGQAVKMLKDEARLALRLNHPNIVQVYEFDRDAEGYFLVMEFVDGPNLAQLLHERRARGSMVPQACSVAIAIDLLRALHYAHRLTDENRLPLGVVHRDVSPGNVLLSNDGMVKLGDFGIAKARGRLQTTVAGTVKGKIPYMAPEQVSGGEVDGRSDLFSASLVLWECLAGVRCYESDDEIDLIRQVLKGRIRSFEEVGARVPSSLAAIVQRGLEADPARRYPSAGAMAQALEKYHRRAHPDFGPEYLAALLNGTVPATQITSSALAPSERTEAAISMDSLKPSRSRSAETSRQAPPRRPTGEVPSAAARGVTRRADDVMAELATERPLPRLGSPEDDEDEPTALERRPKNVPPRRR